MRLVVLLAVLVSGLFPADLLGVVELQKNDDYLESKRAISQHLPELAIPRLQKLLENEDLGEPQKCEILTLLGEAQVRAKLLDEALDTLSDPLLSNFSPSHFWIGNAYILKGHYNEAIDAFEEIDRLSMVEDASLTIASLQISLGLADEALPRLSGLIESKNEAISREATLRLIDIHLTQEEYDDAAQLLESFEPTEASEEGLGLYLRGRIQLGKGERVDATESFSGIVNRPILETQIPAPIFHSATLALIDSISLEGNYGPAILTSLEIIERFPDSPLIDEIFSRLKTWSQKTSNSIPTLLQKLESWLPGPDQSAQDYGLIEGATIAGLGQSSSTRSYSLRSIYSLHLYASIHLRSDDPTQQNMALRRLRQLQSICSSKTINLLADSIIETGLFHFKSGNLTQSLYHFEALSDSLIPVHLQAYGAAFVGQVLLAINEPEQASSAFLSARDLALEAGLEDLALTSTLNSATTLIAAGSSQALDELDAQLKSPRTKSFLLLERGLNLANRRSPDARKLLSRFIAENPESSRFKEAALALAENALFIPRDRRMAEVQAKSLSFDLETQPVLFARHVLVLLELGLGVDLANDFLIALPDHEFSPRILFQLGQSYRTGGIRGPENAKVGQAYISFNRFLQAYPEHELSEAARFLCAISAAASGTPTSTEEALSRYLELAQDEGPLANEARVARISLLIDSGQQEVALKEIESVLSKQDLTNTDRYRLIIMGADAHGQLNENEQALSYYEKLLALPDLPTAWHHRAQFHRGQILERLDREIEALEAYLSVVDRELQDLPQKAMNEWKWFDKCGIDGALALLEKKQRWEAAISLAERLARSGSPRAKDAAASSERISLEQQIFQGR